MNQETRPFERLVGALEPWLDQVVIVGGCAHQLYRFHPYAQELDYMPLVTLDADVAVPARLPPAEQNVRERLLAFGFAEESFGDARPPAAHYCLKGDPSGFYAEFLTPLTGSVYDRGHRSKSTLEVAGIASQQLRHIELLLHRPWWVDFASDGFTARIQVASPVSFLVQKILIHKKRAREDRAKDILYMHDTLELFGARLMKLQDWWRTVVSPQLQPRRASSLPGAVATIFGAVSDDIRRAAEMAAARGLSPEALRLACQYGFGRLFG